MINPFKILGVHRESDEAAIRAAYVARAKAAHPDAGGDGEAFARLNEAYKTLMDRRLRSSFLKNMLIRCRECPQCKGTGATYRQKGLLGRVYTLCAPCGGAGCFVKEED